MRKFCVEFLKRGALFAGTGPIVLCIVWACIQKAGVISTLEVNEVVLGIISTLVLAFVAAGITAIHQMEQLPFVMSGIIHMAVLYVAYLVMYLINGWMPTKVIGIFTIIFIVTFLIIWAIVYVCVRKSVEQMNEKVMKWLQNDSHQTHHLKSKQRKWHLRE